MDYRVMTNMRFGGADVKAGQVLTSEWMAERNISQSAITANLNVGTLAYENEGAAATQASSTDKQLHARIDRVMEKLSALETMLQFLVDTVNGGAEEEEEVPEPPTTRGRGRSTRRSGKGG